LLSVLVAALTLFAVACGGSKTPAVASLHTTSTGSADNASPRSHAGSNGPVGRSAVAFAACMRSHGVAMSASRGGEVMIPAGSDPNSPRFQSAENACGMLLPDGQTRPPITEAQKRRLLAFAACMRKHGLPDWSDPTFPPGGGIMGGGSPHDRGSAEVLRAAAGCNKSMRGGNTG
jgi:hypothetical protein